MSADDNLLGYADVMTDDGAAVDPDDVTANPPDAPPLTELLREPGSALAQLAARGGTVLTVPHDGDTGVPIGMTPDSVVASAKVIVHTFDKDAAGNEFVRESVSYVVDGGAVTAAVGRAAAAVRGRPSGQGITPTTSPVIVPGGLNPVGQLKTAGKAAAKAAEVGRPVKSVVAAVQAVEAGNSDRPAVGVEIDFGPMGKMRASYVAVVIHEQLLVLVSHQASGYAPPVLDPSQTLTVSIDGLATPVRVFSPGMSFPYNGLMYGIFPIDRDE